MCWAKPGPRCFNHVTKSLNSLHAKLDKAHASEKAELKKKITQTRQLLNTTDTEQKRMLDELAWVGTKTKREKLYSDINKGRKLRAQQKTALKRGADPDADVSKINCLSTYKFVEKDGEEKILLLDGSKIIKGYYAKDTKTKELHEDAWKYNQTIPYERLNATVHYGEREKRSWEMAENINTTRINKMLPNGYRAVQEGSNNSTVADIAIKKGNNTLGYVEVKMAKAQAGQIVVQENKKGYYSTQDTNHYTSDIMGIMNRAKNSGNEAEYLSNLSDDEQKTVNNWFKFHYKSKNATLLAVTDKKLEYTAVFPVQHVEKYAKITLNPPRRKSSGSSRLPQKEHEKAKEIIEREVPNIDNVVQRNGRLYVATNSRRDPKDKGYLGKDRQYFMSPVRSRNDSDSYIYEIRKISKVKAPTVMFNFEYVEASKTMGSEHLDEFLEKYQK